MIVFSRVILYFLVAVLTSSVGSATPHIKWLMHSISLFFLLMGFAAVDKALDFKLSPLIFDYVMTIYLVYLVGTLARTVWSTGNNKGGK